MIARANALKFDSSIASKAGACEPLIISIKVERNGEEIDAYAKLTDKLPMKTKAYAVEAISSMLAKDLGLYTPEPFAVHFSDPFINAVHDEHIQNRLLASERLAYATKKLPNGFSEILKDYPLDGELLNKAFAVFAFDALIENPDRGGIECKHNCLIRGEDLAIIDHEKAFSSATMILLPKPPKPWENNGLCHYEQISHLFFNQLLEKSATIEPDDFVTRWRELTDSQINAYATTLPIEWKTDSAYIDKLLRHIIDVRDNLDGCVTEILRVLGKLC